jgi:hypothetical protein
MNSRESADHRLQVIGGLIGFGSTALILGLTRPFAGPEVSPVNEFIINFAVTGLATTLSSMFIKPIVDCYNAAGATDDLEQFDYRLLEENTRALARRG